MACYEYLKESTWLGWNYYTPDVDVTVKALDGSPVIFTFEVDSGASITLAPRSLAAETGVQFDAGTPVQLSGVGGAVFTAYVHTFDCSVGDANFTIPIAIAPDESFPPLLGRLGLYDQANVLMNNDEHAACIGEVSEPIAQPWNLDTWFLVGGLGLVAVLGMMVFKEAGPPK